MLLTYKNEITILYSGQCRNTYFEIKRSGGNDEQNKQNEEKRGLSKVTSFTIHHVYSYREVPMFSLNLLKRTLWLFLLNLVTSGLFQVGLVACQYGND